VLAVAVWPAEDEPELAWFGVLLSHLIVAQGRASVVKRVVVSDVGGHRGKAMLFRLPSKAVVQIAYHPNFKGQDTLLFAGSREDIEFFRAFFIAWNGDELDVIEYLQKRGEVKLFWCRRSVCGGAQRETLLCGRGTAGCG
jgi:hypothetical protein